MRGRRTLVVGAVLAAAAVVGGCSVHPGAAAVVDGREISPDAVALATEQLRDVLQSPTGTTLPEETVLQLLIDAPYYIEAADEAGVGVTAEQARQAMDDNLRGRDMEPPSWTTESVDVARYVLVLTALNNLDDGGAAAAEAEEAARAADVTVNPRYGERDPETGLIADAQHDWIVSAEPDPAGAGR